MRNMIVFAICAAAFVVVDASAVQDTVPQEWAWKYPLPQGNKLYAIQAVDESTAFAVGDVGVAMRTTDAGITWSVSWTRVAQPLRGVFFVDRMHGTEVGDSGIILQTEDGGATWLARPSGTTAGREERHTC